MADSVPTLVGEFVVLRPFHDRDVGMVRSVADDPLIPLITTVPTSGSARDACAYIERQRDRFRSGVGYSFVIADNAANQAVGQIGLWPSAADRGPATIGYWIAPRFRRRGFARAALATLSSWALGLDGVERLEAYIEPWNEASWRAAEACGFTRERLLRSWQLVGQQRKDMYLYSRIAAG